MPKVPKARLPEQFASDGVILGAWIAPWVSVANIRSAPSLQAKIIYRAVRHEVIGKVSSVRKTSTGYWLRLDKDTTPFEKEGWVHFNIIYMITKRKNRADEAKDLLKHWVTTDQKTFLKLLDLQNKTEKINLPQATKRKLQKLIASYNSRQKKLRKASFVKKYEASLNKLISKAETLADISYDYAKKLGKEYRKYFGGNVTEFGPTIGVPWAYIAVAVTGVAVTAAIAYYLGWINRRARDAARDYAQTLVIDKEIKNILRDLPEEKANKVEDYIRDVAEGAYQSGYKAGTTTSTLGNLKALGFILLGAGAIYMLSSKSN